MRILHVTDTYLPRLGGIELHVADLAARQQAAGHDVHVLTAERRRAPGPTPVTTIDGGRTGLGRSQEIRRVLSGFRPHVVHAHLSVGSPFAWAVLRAVVDTPTVVSLHSLLPDSPAVVRIGLAVTGVDTRRITMTAVSEVAARRLEAGLPRGRSVGVLHNGIDAAAWAVEHVDATAFRVLAVGRLAARKRPLVLVNALAQLAERHPDLEWSATIVGDGPQRRGVAAAIHAHGLDDRVLLAGALPRAAIRELLKRTDAFVAPAVLESFGIAALEARCAGVPVVGMAGSGITEFVGHEVDGLLARTDHDLVRELARVATEPLLAGRLRGAAARAPARLDWAHVLAEHEQVYSACRPGVPALRRT